MKPRLSPPSPRKYGGDAEKKRENLHAIASGGRAVKINNTPHTREVRPEDLIVVTREEDPDSPFCDQSSEPRVADEEMIDSIMRNGILQDPTIKDKIVGGKLRSFVILGRRRVDGFCKANLRYAERGQTPRLIRVQVRNDWSDAQIREAIITENARRKDISMAAMVDQARYLIEEYRAELKAQQRPAGQAQLHARAAAVIGVTVETIRRWMQLKLLPLATQEAIYSGKAKLALVDDLKDMEPEAQAQAIELATGAPNGQAAKDAASSAPRHRSKRRSAQQWEAFQGMLGSALKQDGEVLLQAKNLDTQMQEALLADIAGLAESTQSKNPIIRAILRVGALLTSSFAVCELSPEAAEQELGEPGEGPKAEKKQRKSRASEEQPAENGPQAALQGAVIREGAVQVGDLLVTWQRSSSTSLDVIMVKFGDTVLSLAPAGARLVRALATAAPGFLGRDEVLAAVGCKPATLPTIVYAARQVTDGLFEIEVNRKEGYRVCVPQEASDKEGVPQEASDKPRRQVILFPDEPAGDAVPQGEEQECLLSETEDDKDEVDGSDSEEDEDEDEEDEEDEEDDNEDRMIMRMRMRVMMRVVMRM